MSNILLLEDLTFDDKFEICEETVKGEPKLLYRGVLARANYANKNKRVYPMSVMEGAVRRAEKMVSERSFVGELDHPPQPKVNVEKISHLVTGIKLMEDGTVVGEMEPLDTDAGRNLKAMMRSKVKLGVSTRGTGTVKPYKGTLGEGLVEVNPDFNLIAVDVVFNPSNDAWPEIVTESSHVMLGNTEKFKKIWNEVFNK